MKRFIKNLLIFAIIISMITVAVNFVYIKRYRADPYCINKFSSIPSTLQICNFGSSFGLYGFNYEDFENEYDCFNFGLTQQYFSYDYRLFQYYGNHIVEGTVVFIVVSYQRVFGAGETYGDNFIAKNKRYYSILPASMVKEYDLQTDLLIRYIPALATNIGDLIITLIGRSRDTNDQLWQEVITDAEIAEEVAKISDGSIASDYSENIIENQEEIDMLYALISECQEKGAIPVLLRTPLLQDYTDALKKSTGDLFDRFDAIIDRVVSDTGVEYYDYLYDERFANEQDWFMDTLHLNKEGARNFTNIVMEEIVYANGYLDK